MATTLVVPRFSNEAEEAEWWYANRDLVEQNFVAAAKEGRLGQSTMVRRLEERRAQLGEAVVHLDAEEAAKARAGAERHGMELQPFVKMLLHQALQQDEAAS